MTYIVRNTINGKAVKDGITGKVVSFESRERAEKLAASMTRSNRAMAAYRMKATRFHYEVEALA